MKPNLSARQIIYREDIFRNDTAAYFLRFFEIFEEFSVEVNFLLT